MYATPVDISILGWLSGRPPMAGPCGFGRSAMTLGRIPLRWSYLMTISWPSTWSRSHIQF